MQYVKLRIGNSSAQGLSWIYFTYPYLLKNTINILKRDKPRKDVHLVYLPLKMESVNRVQNVIMLLKKTFRKSFNPTLLDIDKIDRVFGLHRATGRRDRQYCIRKHQLIFPVHIYSLPWLRACGTSVILKWDAGDMPICLFRKSDGKLIVLVWLYFLRKEILSR